MEILDSVFEDIYQALDNDDEICVTENAALIKLIKNTNGFSLFKTTEESNNNSFYILRHGDLLCGIKNTSDEIITLDVLIKEKKINELVLYPNETNFIYGEILLPLISMFDSIILKTNKNIKIDLIYALLDAEKRRLLYHNKFYYKFNDEYLYFIKGIFEMGNENSYDYQNMYELKSFKNYDYILK